MTAWSHWPILQALGWATLSSLWQMGLLWCLFTLVVRLLKPGSIAKYRLATATLLCGFVWFMVTFACYSQTASVWNPGLTMRIFIVEQKLVQALLISASVTYLALLLVPAFHLYKNWRFVGTIRRHGLQKAGVETRVFVQKIAAQLGIRRKVQVFVSHLVQSPLTIGYLKPMILLPFAAANQLSFQQTEAVLLHELSHIRRFDYLLNLFVSVVFTVLYFNPFAKKLVHTIEVERENCCDELVLQFGYNKIAYAGTLLQLQKLCLKPTALAIAATGRNFLLNRIEKITGVQQHQRFSFRHWTGILSAVFCVAFFYSLLVFGSNNYKNEAPGLVNTFVGNPFTGFLTADNEPYATGQRAIAPKQKVSPIVPAPVEILNTVSEKPLLLAAPLTQPETAKTSQTATNFKLVASDDVENSLTGDQKEQVAQTVRTTKTVLTKLQWKAIEGQIADALTPQEKALAKKAYQTEVEQLNWKNVENNLKSNYQLLDWDKINTNLAGALTIIQLDSLESFYSKAISELKKAAETSNTVSQAPMPDMPLHQIHETLLQLETKLTQIKGLRSGKPVVRL